MGYGASCNKAIAFAVCTLLVIAIAIVINSCKRATRFPHLNKITNGIFLEKVPPTRTRPREISEKGLQLTEDSEGFVPTLYDDAAGYCSIAFGHLVKRAGCDGTESPEFQNGVSFDAGQELLTSDMTKAETVVMLSARHDLTDGEFGALCDFVYNVGEKNFRNSTLSKVVKINQLNRVPGQFRRWVLAGGRPLQGLVRRREREIVLFFDGLPKFKGAAPVGENLSPIDVTLGEQ